MLRRFWRTAQRDGGADTCTNPALAGKRASRQIFTRRPGLSLWLLCFTIVIGIAGLLAVELRSRYVFIIADAERAAQSYTDILAEHTARTFEAIELTLLVAKSIRNDVNAGRITQSAAKLALQNLQKSSPALLAVGWSDKDGNSVQSSYPDQQVRRNIADLDSFKVQRDGGSDGIYIAKLFRSQQNGKWISAVSLRLENNDGSFAGVVSAPLDLSYFARTYRTVQLGSNDLVTLARADGELLTREPFVESIVGQSYQDTVLFQKKLPQSSFGTFDAISPIDRIERIYGYRVVPGLPLIMVVASDRSTVLAPWFAHLRNLAPLITLLTAAVFFVTYLLWRRTQELAVQTGLLQATLENMHEGLIVVDQSDRIAICNIKAMEMLGLPESMMLARPTSTEVIAYQRQQGEFDQIPEGLKAVIQPRLHGETAHVYQRVRPNGTIVEVQTVPFANGGSIRTYKDITLQKLTEKELTEGEARYRLLADNATDIIARLNFTGKMLYISPSSYNVLGYHPTELTGTLVTDFIHHEDVATVVAFFTQLVKGKSRGRKTIEYRFLHKREHWIWLEASPTVVFDNDGRAVELVDVVRDISKRKIVEAEAELQHRRAEQAAAAQGQFLATMSHELRTPLNSIVGFADIVIERTDLAPDARRQIKLIQTASDTLLAVVNDILDFSQIEEGKMTLDAIAFDLETLIDESLSIVQGSAIAKQLDLRAAKVDTTSVRLVGDDRRLRQVLLNLLNNAIKFTARGSVTLAIEHRSDVPGREHLRFAVTDTGIGIAPHQIERLFQRFTQVDGAINRDFGGSGLGLAISKRLIEAMGGTIGVESVPGQGSTFWFTLTLPVADAVDQPIAKGHQPTTRSIAPHILLVEDVEVNREIAAVTLRSLGYRVDIANDGMEAIAAVRTHTYDVVLMDIQMPGMDGLAATQIIRSMPSSTPAVPIIAMTANVLPTQIEAFRQAGMNGHIGKPFKRDDLAHAIERCLSGEPADAPAKAKAIDLSFDPEAMATLGLLLGAAKVDVLLDKLREQLRDFMQLLDASPLDRALLGQHAHKMVSSAGMLGFRGLSALSSRLEIALSMGYATPELIDQTRDLCNAVLADHAMRPMTQRLAIGGAGRAG